MTEMQGITRAPEFRRRNRWTPARWFLLASAVVHVPLGVLGLLINRSFPIGPDAAETAGSAHLFGVLETNGWHSLAALVIGLVSLYFTVNPAGARTTALALGVGHVAVTLSLAVADPSTFSFASNNADQVIHASTATGGIVSGLLTRSGTYHGAS